MLRAVAGCRRRRVARPLRCGRTRLQLHAGECEGSRRPGHDRRLRRICSSSEVEHDAIREAHCDPTRGRWAVVRARSSSRRQQAQPVLRHPGQQQGRDVHGHDRHRRIRHRRDERDQGDRPCERNVAAGRRGPASRECRRGNRGDQHCSECDRIRRPGALVSSTCRTTSRRKLAPALPYLARPSTRPSALRPTTVRMLPATTRRQRLLEAGTADETFRGCRRCGQIVPQS